jgi:hypothetical protein
MKRFVRDNGLSLVLFGLFFLTLLFQSVAGKDKYNEDQDQHGRPQVSYLEYLKSDDFIEATAENWESEFLQMFAFVVLTRFLYQKGSSESRDPDGEEEEENTPPEKLPWPVRRGGWVLKLYEHSLSLTFLFMFIVSVLMHAVGGAGQYNQEQMDHGEDKRVSALGYLFTSSFWFESMQNWQSEFLSLFAMVVCTIWLREKGSPESKEVRAPHDKTGG